MEVAIQSVRIDKIRAKLAEAMGWERTKYDRWLSPSREMRCDDPPDPFTDANDDYAVLEWFRAKEKPKHSAEWCEFWMGLNHSASYEIGDYAKAMISALDRQETK